jgi:phenylpropionate dioxygenase-like ring-hydroxylating dioxygenase large terminal subunit
MFLRNAWYVAAWDREVTAERPFARVLLNEPVVLYRNRAGKVVALEDRCCHRHFPLHEGTILGDLIECGYHGFTYDATGKCVRVPGQDVVPPAARVRSYPVVERYRWIWVWMGEPAAADPAKICDFHWLDHPAWGAKGDVLHVKANYELIIENLLDLTHLAFLHRSTIGNAATAEQAQVRAQRTETDVTVTRWMVDTPPPPTYVKAGGFTGNVDRWQFINFMPPAFVRLDVGACAAGVGARRLKTGAFAAEGAMPGGIEMRNLNAITPETARSTHYFWAQAHNFMVGDPKMTDLVFEQVKTAFDQDVTAIEAQQRNIDLDPAASRIDVYADAGQIHAIRLLRRRIAEEREAAGRLVA